MIRLIIVLFCLCIFSSNNFGQSDAFVEYYKKDWSPAKDFDQATYFMHAVKENDSTYICRYYRKTGPMVKWETYKDPKLEIPNGRFAWYNAKGKLDSMGMVVNGKKDRNWYYGLDDSMHAKVEEYFEDCRFQVRKNYVTRTVTYKDGSSKSFAELEKEEAEQKKKETKEFTVVQSPADFEGGIAAWSSYLSKNLVTPERLLNLTTRSTRAVVGVLFIVDKEGNTGDVFIHKSYEWSADMEAIRVIKSAPKWTPALQNGKKVIYRHRQNITYDISIEE